MSAMAFDAGFLKTLEALNLLARRTLSGDDRAERLTPRKGASLGYIGLANYDTLSLFTFGSEVRPVKKFLRGKGRVMELLAAVDGIQTEGATDMKRAFGPALPRLRG